VADTELDMVQRKVEVQEQRMVEELQQDMELVQRMVAELEPRMVVALAHKQFG